MSPFLIFKKKKKIHCEYKSVQVGSKIITLLSKISKICAFVSHETT